MGRRGFNETTVAAIRCRRIQRATHIHRATFHTTHQHDAAGFAGDQRLRLDHASVVDRVGQQTTGRLGGQQHLAAVGTDQTAVLHQCIDCAFVDGNVEQAVTSHVERHDAARCQHHAAQLRRDSALVADVGAQQGYRTAVGIEATLVQHGTRAIARELVVAGQKVAVADVQGRSQQAAHVDRCALAKQDAVGVDQENLAVGAQATQDA